MTQQKTYSVTQRQRHGEGTLNGEIETLKSSPHSLEPGNGDEQAITS